MMIRASWLGGVIYRYFLKKVQREKPGRRLLLKNPANSVRVAELRARFPGAKFIHLHRHPEDKKRGAYARIKLASVPPPTPRQTARDRLSV